MKQRTRALIALALLVPSAGTLAAPDAPAGSPRIGLVLSGGGARGAAHIGVIKILEELRIPVHAIAGTSMGSLVGGAYAAGLGAGDLERAVTGVDWNELFNDDAPRALWPARRKEGSYRPTWNFSIGVREGKARLPPGAIAGQNVQLFLSELTKGVEHLERFDELPIPFRAVATDLETGTMKVFERGSLPLAMRASMSVPGVFAPLHSEGRIYVDGGLVRNTPVDVAREMGVDHLIVVRLLGDPMKPEQLNTVVGVAGQMINILISQNESASLAEIDPVRDVLVQPNLGDIGSGQFNRAADAIAIGERAARAATPLLARFSRSEADYAAWRRATGRPARPIERVEEVRVVGLERVNPKVFAPLERDLEKKPLDRERLVDDIRVVYAKGDFERVSYRFEREDEGDVLVVDAVEKSWGPGYFSLGLGFSSDNEGDDRFGLRGTYRQSWLNRLGAEWTTSVTVGNEPKLTTELFQPLRLDRAVFVAPYLDYSKTPLSVFRDDRRVARYDIARTRAGADLGTTLENGIEARVGAYFLSNDTQVDTGPKALPEGSVNESGARVRVSYDTLDSPYLPRTGNRVTLEVNRPLPSMGAETDFTRAYARWTGAWAFGEHTVSTDVRGGSSFGDHMPFYEQFALGGFTRLSGNPNERFRGNQMALGNLIYHRQIATLPAPLGRGLYVGGSLEAGRLWDVEEAIDNPSRWRFGSSVFFGADTWIGPVFLAYGLSDEGDHTLYFMLGRP